MFPLHFAILILPSLLILSTLCVPQGVTEIIRPPGASPPGCVDSYPGPFSIQDVDHTTSGTETECFQPGTLKVILNKGLLVDHLGRIGSIVANRQFQFDGPPAQAGAIYTGGWSLCPDNLIALGPQKLFYACPSGDCKLPENFKTGGAAGGGYIDTCAVDNIYDSMIAYHCRPIFLKFVLLVEC